MMYVRAERAGALVERARGAIAAVTGSPDWPFVAAATLSLVAMVEIINRSLAGTASTFAMLLALCVTLPVALVRIQLVVAAVAITVAMFLSMLAQSPPPRAGMVGLVAVCYLLGRHRRRRVWVPIITPYVVYAATPFGWPWWGGRYLGVLLAVLTVGAAAVGAAVRAHEEARSRQESNRVIADTILEHAARGERARIARDLHDVVAHHLSMISIQAEAARLTVPGMPPEGTKRLSAIGATARAALTEMRRLLGVLREDAGGGLARKPQPGLDQLNELIDEARGLTGASTRLIVRGRVVPLDSGVELAAYRIIQEALTNARRHAPGAAVDVELRYADDTLCIRVRDNGPGPADELSTGHGLQGMRERAAMVGGTLRIASASAGGFLVEATLPVSSVDT
jgi:signal transduction histidine kinase